MEAREGLAQVIRRVGASVYPVANGSTEDVVQEACARAIKSGVSLEAEQWLRTVAKRVAIDQHRRKRETPSGGAADLEQWSTVGDGDPEDAYIRTERQAAVREALDALPPRYRKALLAYAEEDSPAKVADRLGLSAAATWTLLSRARSRLKLQLESTGFVPALFASGSGRPRLRTLLAAGAVAATAATATVVPMVTNPDPAPKPKPAVIETTQAKAEPAKAIVPEPEAVLPGVAAPEVTDTVNDAVGDIDANKDVSVKAAPCLGPDDEPLPVAELNVVKEEAPLLANVIEAVPEPLRDPLGELTC